jgi:hypothetical protein
MAVLISFQNVDFSTTLKAVLLAGYGFTIGGLACYFGELVKTQVQFYASH